MADDDGFLSRWSRRKAGIRRGLAPAEPGPPRSAGDVADGVAHGVADHKADPSLDLSDNPSVDRTVHGRAAGPTRVARAARDLPAAPRAVSPPPSSRATGAHDAAETGPDGPPTAPVSAAAPVAPPAPTWDDVARLSPASDFSRFVRPDVDPAVRNAALKTLFAAPQFNVMDGLDVYIDDYSLPSPLPASMLRKLAGAVEFGLVEPPAPPAGPTSATTAATSPVPPTVAAAHATPAAGAAPAHSTPPSGAADALPAPAPAGVPARPPDRDAAATTAHAAAPPHHEDTDLRLQPNDAARPAGAGPGARAHPGRER